MGGVLCSNVKYGIFLKEKIPSCNSKRSGCSTKLNLNVPLSHQNLTLGSSCFSNYTFLLFYLFLIIKILHPVQISIPFLIYSHIKNYYLFTSELFFESTFVCSLIYRLILFRYESCIIFLKKYVIPFTINGLKILKIALKF